LPDFLLIGAQRGGTTSLYHYLVRHPGIAGAVLDKELHFFDLGYQRGLERYRAAFPTNASLALATRRTGSRPLVGEATPYYLFHPLVPARVAATLPDVRLLAILRDPVERAWSHYRHEVDLGFESLPFPEALDREDERLAGEHERILADPAYASFALQHHSYAARGRYAEQLDRWFAAFPKDRLLLVRAEDFYAEPARAFGQVLDFLGVDAWEPPTWRTYNAATSTGIPADARDRLRDHFEGWNVRLAELTGRDFSWGR
jgi:hypothetical protein